jgi:tetratricopeptide (TPR) repeat protein
MLGVVLAVAAFSRAALAAPPVAGDSSDGKAKAQKVFEDGKREYNLGHFDTAAGLFEQAYDLFRAPEFLFNIGQCYRNLGQNEKAIFVYESYLRDKPETKKRAMVEGFLTELRDALAAERDAEQRRNEQQRKEEEARKQLEEQKRQAELAEIARKKKEGQLTALEQKQREQALLEKQRQLDAERLRHDQEAAEGARLVGDGVSERPLYKKWWFWAAAGSVTAVAIGGIAFAVSGSELPEGSLGTIDGRR